MLKVLDPAREENAETTDGVAPTLAEVAREDAPRISAAALERPAYNDHRHATKRLTRPWPLRRVGVATLAHKDPLHRRR